MKNALLWLVLIGLLFATSCSYKNKNILFRTDKKYKPKDPPVIVLKYDSLRAVNKYRHVIKIGDRVVLRFLNTQDLSMITGQNMATMQGGAMGGADNKGYLVNYDSTVAMPLIGRVNLVGMDRLQAARYLEDKFEAFSGTKPIIDVNIASLVCSVLGDVGSQGQIPIDRDNTTLTEVLALAGGFIDGAQKDRVKIIRGKEVIIANMKDINALKSPDIIIQHNDIVYVEPYGAKARTEPLLSTGVTTVFFISLQVILLTLQLMAISGSL
jgi:polysaccharide export outer membrane protein